MTDKTAGQTLLEQSYKLSTPEGNAEYYNAFASTYDDEFADMLGWHYPAAIAAAYRDAATDHDTPIVDIGCGTGLVAVGLKRPRDQIDGVDISAEMLEIAKEKALYRGLYQVDITASLDQLGSGYGAVLSAGTFTYGHVGPEALRGLLDIARPGALFVIGVRRTFFETAGFQPVLEEMQSARQIRDLQVAEIPMYAKAGHDHSDDTAFALVYRKV